MTHYSPELADEICRRIVGGESLRAICRDAEMPDPATVHRWASDRPEFQAIYAAAMQSRLDAWAEDLVAIADDGDVASDAVQRDRLKIDTRKWVMSKLSPKKYGDRLGLEHSGSIAASQPLDLSGLTQNERDTMRELLRLNDERLAARSGQAPQPPKALEQRP